MGNLGMLQIKPALRVTPEIKPGTCWRCGGEGIVESVFGTTPCGACLGTKIPPKPCPKCGSIHAKIMTHGGVPCCWYCRDCHFEGPWHAKDEDAMEAWNNLERK